MDDLVVCLRSAVDRKVLCMGDHAGRGPICLVLEYHAAEHLKVDGGH